MFFIPAQGEAKVMKAFTFRLGHFFDKLIISFAALGQIGEIDGFHILKFWLIKLAEDILDLFRGRF